MDTKEQAREKALDFARDSIEIAKGDFSVSLIDVAEYEYRFDVYKNNKKIGEFPFTDMEEGDLYEVSDYGHYWHVRRFSRFSEDDGRPLFASSNGQKGDHLIKWAHYRLICKKENFETSKGE